MKSTIMWAVLTIRNLARLFTLLLLVCLVSGAASAQTVVLSEDFESTSGNPGGLPSGWTGAPWRTLPYATLGGLRAANVNNNDGTLVSPNFTTEANALYEVSFQVRQENAARFSLSAGRVGGTQNVITVDPAGIRIYTFTAQGTSSQIQFAADYTGSGNSNLYLDNITVTKKVPELDASAAQLPLTLLVGLLLVLYDRRRAMIGCG